MIIASLYTSDHYDSFTCAHATRAGCTDFILFGSPDLVARGIMSCYNANNEHHFATLLWGKYKAPVFIQARRLELSKDTPLVFSSPSIVKSITNCMRYYVMPGSKIYAVGKDVLPIVYGAKTLIAVPFILQGDNLVPHSAGLSNN